jgi:hypothetical protein
VNEEDRRRSLVYDARAIVGELWPYMEGGSCAYTSLVLCALSAKRRALRLCLQAGTLKWIYTRDDVSPIAFCYDWEPDSGLTKARIADNKLPEMHVWCGDVENQHLIDATTRELVGEAKRIVGKTWTAPEPPDYLWAGQGGLPAGVRYSVSESATILAGQLLFGKPLDRLKKFWRSGGRPS